MALNVTITCLKSLICRYPHQLFNMTTNSQHFKKTYPLFKTYNCSHSFDIYSKLFCSDLQLGQDPLAGPKPKRKKTVEEIKITLFDDKNIKMSTTIEQANKLAKSRNLKLVKVKDATAVNKAIYELISFSKIVQDETQEENNKEKLPSIKQKKIMAISSKITDHDLEIKIKNIKKVLLKKNCLIHVVIGKEGSDNDIQSIIKKIDNSVKGLGTLDKKISVKNSKFYITPIQEDSSPSNL